MINVGVIGHRSITASEVKRLMLIEVRAIEARNKMTGLTDAFVILANNVNPKPLPKWKYREKLGANKSDRKRDRKNRWR